MPVLKWVTAAVYIVLYLYCYFRPSASNTKEVQGLYILYSNYSATSGRVPVLPRWYSGWPYILYCTYTVTQAECQYYKEVHQLDVKFQQQYDEINQKRLTIINGSYEPSGVEVNNIFFGKEAYESDCPDSLAYLTRKRTTKLEWKDKE